MVKNYNMYSNFSRQIAKNPEMAEDHLHDTFLYFMGKEEDNGPAPHSYFYQAVKGRFLNFMRTKASNPNLHLYIDKESKLEDPSEAYIEFLRKYSEEPDYLKNISQIQMEYLRTVADKILDKRFKQYKTFNQVLKGKTVIEIHKETGVPYSTVKANFRHAFLKVKKFVEENPLEY